jgi:dihydroorotate dehydrogenase electron transfer subunit
MENKTELPKIVTIKKIVDETPQVKTFYFDYELKSRPGQFVMLWLPEVDEVPISIALDAGKEFALTICARGDATKKICDLKEGDKLGIRGPYGTMFNYEEGETLGLIGGGYGSAPLFALANEAKEKGCKIHFIEGARSKEHIVYLDELKKLSNTTAHFSTDDGSEGHKGYPTDLLEKLVAEEKIDRIMTCGPELMMKRVGEIGDEKGINTQISVERYMKCGFGVCGQCVLDPLGIRTCVSGPVMNSKVLKMLDEFGQYHRDDLGRKQYFSNPTKK